jgi:hypothetical protein
MHVADDNATESDNKKKTREAKNAMRAQTTDPTPKSPRIFSFLEDLWEDGQPDKLTLHACYGEAGMRLGPQLKEFVFKPNADRPTQPELVALTNLIMQYAQEDCDVLDKKTRYAILAYDLLRSDRSYARKTVKVFPSGMSEISDEERIMGDGDDEGGGSLSTKLVLDLLAESRRHERWMFESTMTTLSGVLERDARTIAMHQKRDTESFERQVKYITATEAALSQVHARKLEEDWQEFKREAALKALSMLGLAVPHVAKAIEQHRASKAQAQVAAPGGDVVDVTPEEQPAEAVVVEPNPVRDFLESITPEQGEVAFGKYNEDGTPQAPGVFTLDQVQLFAVIAGADKPDEATMKQLFDSITPEQMNKAQEIFELTQLVHLMPLMAQFGMPGSK